MNILTNLHKRIINRSVAAFLLPFMLYITTLAPTIYNLDSAELTTAAATGGLVRATGYPLYLFLGHIWSKIPIGDVGYRMNLFSALCGAISILLAERILSRLKVNGWATFGALGLLATSPYFWGLSLIAEVYMLQVAIMAALILALLCWAENPTPARLGAASFLGGLGLAHHMATTLLIPGAVIYVISISRSKAFAPRSIVFALAGGVLGLIPYLYLPLRYITGPAFNYAGFYDVSLHFNAVNLSSLSGIWWLISGQEFAGQMFAYSPKELGFELIGFTTLLWQAFFAIGIGPGVLGWISLHARNLRLAAMLDLMWILSTVFFINYRVLDKSTMFLPSLFIWALWVGIGFQAILEWLEVLNEPPVSRWIWVIPRVLIVGVVLLATMWNWRLVDLSNDWSTRQRGESILSHVEYGAVVFGWWDTVPVVQYLQFVEGLRPDVEAINRFLIPPDDLVHVIEKEVNNRPIYLDNMLNVSNQNWRFEQAGPIYRLVPDIQAVVPGKFASGNRYTGR
jgi:hypothetical protein